MTYYNRSTLNSRNIIKSLDESGIPKVSENPPVYQLGELRHGK